MNMKWTWTWAKSEPHSLTFVNGNLSKIWARNEPRSWVNWNERRSRSLLPISDVGVPKNFLSSSMFSDGSIKSLEASWEKLKPLEVWNKFIIYEIILYYVLLWFHVLNLLNIFSWNRILSGDFQKFKLNNINNQYRWAHFLKISNNIWIIWSKL